jgi:anti-anti-sigma factor
MKLTVISRDEQAIHVGCEGTVTLIPAARQRALFEDLLGPGCFAHVVLLDVGRTDYIDSSGFSWLILSHKYFRQEGGLLVIHSLPPALRRIADMMHLSSVLHLAADESAARILAKARS